MPKLFKRFKIKRERVGNRGSNLVYVLYQRKFLLFWNYVMLSRAKGDCLEEIERIKQLAQEQTRPEYY